MSEMVSAVTTEQPSLSALGREPRYQIGLCVWWIGVGLGVFFFTGVALDFGMVFFGPLFLAVLLVWGLWLLVRGSILGWRLRHDASAATLVTLSPVVVIVAFGFLIFPVMATAGWCQAALILLVNQRTYERTMANPTPRNLRSNDARSAGRTDMRIWAFARGGFLSNEEDIVYDPQDRPEGRSVELLGAKLANCERLWSHYYSCGFHY